MKSGFTEHITAIGFKSCAGNKTTMKPGDLVYWKQWEPGYTEPISAIGLLLEDPIGYIKFEVGNKVYKAYKAKVLISQNSAIITLLNINLDVLQ